MDKSGYFSTFNVYSYDSIELAIATIPWPNLVGINN